MSYLVNTKFKYSLLKNIFWLALLTTLSGFNLFQHFCYRQHQQKLLLLKTSLVHPHKTPIKNQYYLNIIHFLQQLSSSSLKNLSLTEVEIEKELITLKGKALLIEHITNFLEFLKSLYFVQLTELSKEEAYFFVITVKL